MKRILIRGGKLLALLAGLVMLYVCLLLLAYSFPDEWIEDNVRAAVAVLEEEGNMEGGYAMYFWHDGIGVTDNLTDREIYKGLLRGGRSTAEAAMRTDYARYWHGYAVLMRPLCTVLSIINIRYVNMMLMFSLFVLCYWHCRRRLGAWTAFAFSAGLLMSFILIAPFCQQYTTVYLITLLSCWGILRFWEKIRRWLPEVFLVTGSAVCFFDFLTFPVLALGYPLVLCLMLQLKDGEKCRVLWRNWFVLSALWMAGYALTWAGKALCGSLLTGQDVLGDILEQVALRTTGAFTDATRTVEISARAAIEHNLKTFFIGSNAGFFALTLLVYGVYALVRREPLQKWLRALPVAAVALYPFAWYCVLQNHVRMHFWMTHKMLAITVFAALCWLTAARRGALQGGENGNA